MTKAAVDPTYEIEIRPNHGETLTGSVSEPMWGQGTGMIGTTCEDLDHLAT